MIRILSLVLLFTACAPLGNKSIILPEGQTYMTLDSGKVHRTCLKRFGQKLITIINDTTSDGLSCLKNLKGEGAALHYQELKKLYTDKAITYSCHEDNYNWGGKAAHASLSPSWDIPEYDLIHPFISINPNYVLGDSDVKGYVLYPDSLKEILFHETFHHLGYLHGLTPEYAYACEECCFPYTMGNRDAACKICSTKYKDVSEPRYIKDVWEWAGASAFADGIHREVILRNALISKPKSSLHFKYLFDEKDSKNITLKFLAEALPGNKNAAKFSKIDVPSDAQAFVSLARDVAHVEEKMFFKGDIEEAYKYFLKLDPSELKTAINSNEYALILWKEILYDMSAIYTRLIYKRDTRFKVFREKYMEVLAYKK